jgi:hypothetical protein
MIKALIPTLKQLISCVQLYLKQCSKPVTDSIEMGVFSDLRRDRKDLIFENPMLRQQLIVLHRQVKRAQLTQG